jgi:rhamnogalacturonyl hydrolase YesR
LRGDQGFAESGAMEDANEPLVAAVHSIHGFIKRTAERDGTLCSWETIDYSNKPHRHPGVFNGVGGISFFLVDALPITKDPDSIALAQGAINWCAAFSGTHYKRGLHLGKTGAAMAALHKANALNEASTPDFCLSNAEVIMGEPPGPATDLMGGEASNGLYLLRLWQRTRDERHLAAAERCADWLDRTVVRDERGTHCNVDSGTTMGFPPKPFLGVAHGISGLAHFVALLGEATGRERWTSFARELFDTTARYSKPSHGGLNWPVVIGEEELPRCQWSHGCAGIGLTYFTAWRVLREARYLQIALQAAEATYNIGDLRNNLTVCTGLAGGGGLLLEAYAVTGDARWKARAHEFAMRCIAYKEETPEGDAWPTDAKGLHSADFMYGASGVGHFLLRLISGGKLPMPLM